MPLSDQPVFSNASSDQVKLKTANGYIFSSSQMQRYYSQIDMEIYFCNQYVEDLVGLTYAVNQNTLPVFGFNSYTSDSTLLGNRLISGEFAINFTSPNYLFGLLDSIKDQTTILNQTSYAVSQVSTTSTSTTINTSDSASGTIHEFSGQPLWPTTFDIDVILGESKTRIAPVHLVITGVNITYATMQMGYGGRNILNTDDGTLIEVYQFIANDIKNVSL